MQNGKAPSKSQKNSCRTRHCRRFSLRLESWNPSRKRQTQPAGLQMGDCKTAKPNLNRRKMAGKSGAVSAFRSAWNPARKKNRNSTSWPADGQLKKKKRKKLNRLACRRPNQKHTSQNGKAPSKSQKNDCRMLACSSPIGALPLKRGVGGYKYI